MSQLRFLENKNGDHIEIIENLQADWRKLSDFLELPSMTVRNLRHDPDYSPENACRNVLEKWLDGEGIDLKTWGTLMDVLRKMQKTTFANLIFTVLQQRH